MRLAHFYHVFSAGDWQQATAEHFLALQASHYHGHVTVGLVGSPAENETAAFWIEGAWSDVSFIPVTVGYEQVTLRAVHAYARRNPTDAVLYAHGKGAAFPTVFQSVWRRRMTRHVVCHWRDNLDRLEQGDIDAIGCHWLTPEEYPAFQWPIFGGNFWMARCDFLAKLEPCADEPRHAAEAWLGTANPRPRVFDLYPGYPGTPQEVSGDRGVG